jgi:hypothetical protein
MMAYLLVSVLKISEVNTRQRVSLARHINFRT